MIWWQKEKKRLWISKNYIAAEKHGPEFLSSQHAEKKNGLIVKIDLFPEFNRS